MVEIVFEHQLGPDRAILHLVYHLLVSSPLNIRIIFGFAFVVFFKICFCAYADEQGYEKVVFALPLYFEEKYRGDDPDKAVLVYGDDGNFDLYLFVADRVHGFKRSAGPTLIKKDVLVLDGSGGLGTLKVGPNGALLVTLNSDWTPTKRNETVKIIYRDKQFLVAGFSSQVRSAGAPDSAAPPRLDVCNVDFLSGEVTRNKKRFAINRPAPKLADWEDSWPHAICGD